MLGEKYSTFSADDWGMSPGVNDGILELAYRGVIRRVSLLANGKFLLYRLDDLLSLRNVEFGLHFCATFGRPSPLDDALAPLTFTTVQTGDQQFFRSLSQIFCLWLSGFRRTEMAEEFESILTGQLSVLDMQGVRVTAFDSHHHIHLLPGLFERLAPTLKNYGIEKVRVPSEPTYFQAVRRPLFIWSGLLKESIRTLGFVDEIATFPNLRTLQDRITMQELLEDPGFRVIVTHPAKYIDFNEHQIADSLRSKRVKEFELLLAYQENTPETEAPLGMDPTPTPV